MRYIGVLLTFCCCAALGQNTLQQQAQQQVMQQQQDITNQVLLQNAWNDPLLRRRYQAGQIFHYEMTGSNEGWQYSILATDTTQRDTHGRFYEQVGWSNLQSDQQQVMSSDSLAFRQTLSLYDPTEYITLPNLSRIQPFLIGPITDILTIYSDILQAYTHGLRRAGQHAYVEHGKPNSWADGHFVIVGEDAIDFNLRVLGASHKDHTLSLLVQHVPSRHNLIQMPVSWMAAPVAKSPNNWVQVQHAGDTYTAEVGRKPSTSGLPWMQKTVSSSRPRCTIHFYSQAESAATRR